MKHIVVDDETARTITATEETIEVRDRQGRAVGYVAPVLEDGLAAKMNFETRVVRTPGVCGGAARIRGTRIPVWALEQARREGCASSTILANYPALTREDVFVAWEYASLHGDEIDALISANERCEE
jgi:uncharacterized protein (DUF433 family)